VAVRIHEADLGDPAAGLRAGLVDVDRTAEDDALAGHHSVSTTDLAGRRWVRLPDGADPVWAAYWTGGAHGDVAPVMPAGLSSSR
jgi:hypothetical protein